LDGIEEFSFEELYILNKDRKKKNLPPLLNNDDEEYHKIGKDIYDDNEDEPEYDEVYDDGCFNTEYGLRVYGWKGDKEEISEDLDDNEEVDGPYDYVEKSEVEGGENVDVNKNLKSLNIFFFFFYSNLCISYSG
jgi:hypothetical protein